MQEPLGHCYWAVAPFVPAAPFQLFQRQAEPRGVPGAAAFTAAARQGQSEFVVLSRVKVRPVLVISPLLQPYDEVVALRLRRLEKIASESDRDRVRTHRDAALFHLSPARFPKLPVENAAIITSVLRLHVSALDQSESLGHIDENELRVVHERMVSGLDLRLDVLIVQQAQRLLDRLRQP